MNAITESIDFSVYMETLPAIPKCITKTKHLIRVWPIYFLMIQEKRKTAEVRRNTCGFHVGDLMEFSEWEPETQRFTGLSISKKITCISQGPGIADGYVLLTYGDLDFPEPLFKTGKL